MFLSLKIPAKVHLEMLSVKVVCCKLLLSYLTNLKIKTNSVDPDQTAPLGAV